MKSSLESGMIRKIINYEHVASSLNKKYDSQDNNMSGDHILLEEENVSVLYPFSSDGFIVASCPSLAGQQNLDKTEVLCKTKRSSKEILEQFQPSSSLCSCDSSSEESRECVETSTLQDGSIVYKLNSWFHDKDEAINFPSLITNRINLRENKYNEKASAMLLKLSRLSMRSEGKIVDAMKNCEFKDVWIINNRRFHARAIVAYHPKLDSTIVVMRGTKTNVNIHTNFQTKSVKISNISEGSVHSGFLKHTESISEQIISKLVRLKQNYPTSNTVLAGHSLGGVMATLLVDLIPNKFKELKSSIDSIYTWGQPRIGDIYFCQRREREHNENGIAYIRITHPHDPIVDLMQEYRHIKTKEHILFEEKTQQMIKQRDSDIQTNGKKISSFIYNGLSSYWNGEINEFCSPHLATSYLDILLARDRATYNDFPGFRFFRKIYNYISMKFDSLGN